MTTIPRADLTRSATPAQEARQQLGDPYPPRTNRGVERTEPLEGPVLIDWLSYTIPEDAVLEDAVPGGEQLEWVALEHGGLGYRRAAIADGIRVFYDGQDGMGKHVSLSGSACRQLEASHGDELAAWGGWPGYLARVLERGYHITRLDVALDDRAGQLDVPVMRAAAEAEHYTSPYQHFHVERSRRRRGEDFGETLYFGSSSSESHIRIYDKRAEREAKGEAVEGPWVRVELQTKGDTAAAVAGVLAQSEGGLEEFLAVLHQKLDFKTPATGDSNKRRWQTASWWSAFLQHAGKRQLGLAPAVRTLDTVLGWLHRQCAPSLALVLEAAKGDPRVIRILIEDGRDRLRPRHRALLGTAAA